MSRIAAFFKRGKKEECHWNWRRFFAILRDAKEFEEEMSLQLNEYLGSLEGAILYGSKRRVSDPDSKVVQGGVADALPMVCQQLEMAYREKFYEQIVTVEMVE